MISGQQEKKTVSKTVLITGGAGGIGREFSKLFARDGYRVVVNCSTREKDLAWMQQQTAGFAVSVTERPDFAMIAIKGPNARTKVAGLLGDPRASLIQQLEQYIRGE